NVWLPKAFGYLHDVVVFGTGVGLKGLPSFGYAVVPTGVVGLTGLKEIFSSPQSPHMGVTVAAAAVLLLGMIVVAMLTAARGAAAGVVLLGDLIVGLLLVHNDNQFGLFKLYMYVQPFVAATIAVWLSLLSRRLVVAFSALVAAVAGFQIATLNAYA